jgi:hypothetical protein
MRALLESVDAFLRGRGPFAVDAPVAGRVRWLVLFVLAGGGFYGVVMGAFTGFMPGRWPQFIYSGVKVPVLLLVTFLLCLPSFYVLNMLAGLGEDFGEALRAVVGAQSCITIVLAGLAPVTAFLYVCITDYELAVLYNGVMFAIATFSAQVVVRRYYGPLIARNPLHRRMLVAWLVLYVFVGIQMAWVLRPFVGDPWRPLTFFRPDAWGNAYVIIVRTIGHGVETLIGG